MGVGRRWKRKCSRPRRDVSRPRRRPNNPPVEGRTRTINERAGVKARVPDMTAPSHPIRATPGPAEMGSTVDAPRHVGPFTDLTPHAHGGLGEVFRATDPELHRTVAVKRLRAHHADNADLGWRFLLEAEITARLEHPGVVP